MEDIDDSEFVASEHDQLINAITKLDKTQFIKEPTRNEPTNLNSEFNLIKSSSKLNLNNVVKVLEDTSHHVQISKKLKKSQDSKQVLPKPLEKPQAERIKRATGYEQTKERVGRWDPVVARSRTADYVSYPLKHASNKMKPTQEFISKFELKSALEKELDELDPPNVEHVEDEDEKDKVYPMTYMDMLDHRQNSAKLRAQQSYKAAKAKRQSKIKSKKYHRILKKERLKLQLKEFEELQKKDPEEALKKLEALEKARALERHTLRHKNTGKWAKSKLIRAKYDKETRQELAEQLAVSRGLTHKTKDNESSDDDNDNNENIPDITLSQDPMNDWVIKRSDKSNVDAEFDFGYKKYVQGKFQQKSDSDTDSEGETVDPKISKQSNNLEMLLLKESVNKIGQENSNNLNEGTTKNQAKAIKETLKSKEVLAKDVKQSTGSKAVKQKKITKENLKSTKKTGTSKNIYKVVATSNWSVESVCNIETDTAEKAIQHVAEAFDVHEENIAHKVAKKINKLRNDLQQLDNFTKTSRKKTDDKQDGDNLERLKLKKQNVRPEIDEELHETGSKVPEEILVEDKPLANIANMAQSVLVHENANLSIDSSRFVKAKPKYLNSVVPGSVQGYDLLDDDDQVVPKVNFDEILEADDAEESFRQEKNDEINKDKPEDTDQSLPGWGTWGGKGVKAPKRKRNRFITRGAPKMPRRDENKGDIIIKEFKDPKLAVHKVTNVPFPFSSVKDYEASIRAPLGNTFITENAHQKLIKPSVITKAGAIIEPMDEEELLHKKNRNFRNEKVLKLLGKKLN